MSTAPDKQFEQTKNIKFPVSLEMVELDFLNFHFMSKALQL
jgi:hypothetical protein